MKESLVRSNRVFIRPSKKVQITVLSPRSSNFSVFISSSIETRTEGIDRFLTRSRELRGEGGAVERGLAGAHGADSEYSR